MKAVQVQEPCTYQVTVCKPVQKTCQVQVCEYQQVPATRQVCYTVCVPKTQTCTENVTTYKCVPVQQTVKVCKTCKATLSRGAAASAAAAAAGPVVPLVEVRAVPEGARNRRVRGFLSRAARVGVTGRFSPGIIFGIAKPNALRLQKSHRVELGRHYASSSRLCQSSTGHR